jgi:hypothetical protein
MCRGERSRAIIPFSDQFRPYYTTIDICQLRSLQISVDRVLRITRRSVDTAQAHRSWRLNAKFSGVSIEAGRWHVPCSNARRFTGLFVCEGALKSPLAIFPSIVFYILFIDQPRGLVVRVSVFWSWGTGFDYRFCHRDFSLKRKIPMATTVWDNVTAPHGRPILRDRLHFGHNREGRPRSP